MPDEPAFLCPDDRLSELAAILAAGLLRLHARGPRCPPPEISRQSRSGLPCHLRRTTAQCPPPDRKLSVPRTDFRGPRRTLKVHLGPEIFDQNSRTLWLTAHFDLTGRSLSDPERDCCRKQDTAVFIGSPTRDLRTSGPPEASVFQWPARPRIGSVSDGGPR